MPERVQRITLACLLIMLSPTAAWSAGPPFTVQTTDGVRPEFQRSVQAAVSSCMDHFAPHLPNRFLRPVEVYVVGEESAWVPLITRVLGRYKPDYPNGLASGYRIFINQPATLRAEVILQHQDAQRALRIAVTRVICHELTHVHQAEIAGQSHPAAHKWIIEGHAEFMAAFVLDRLQLQTFDEVRDRAVKAFKDLESIGASLPSLTDQATDEQWERSAGIAGAAVYPQNLLAVELLARSDSSRALRGFLFRFASGSSAQRDKYFRESFGMTVPEFERKLKPHLTRPGEAKRARFGDSRFIAGERIGLIRLGMTLGDAISGIGADCTRSTGVMSPSGAIGTQCLWWWPDQRAYQTADGTVPFVAAEVVGQSDYVHSLFTNIRQFATPKGNRVGDTLARFEDEYGPPQAVEQFASAPDHAYARFPGIGATYHKALRVVHYIRVYR